MREEVKDVLLYYKSIPGMVALLREERDALGDEYNTLRAHVEVLTHTAGGVSRPTEARTLRVCEHGTTGRLKEIRTAIAVLEADRAVVRRALDSMGGKYKRILLMKYIDGYSWGKIAAHLEIPESTARYWNGRALDRLGRTLTEGKDSTALLHRAARARTL